MKTLLQLHQKCNTAVLQTDCNLQVKKQALEWFKTNKNDK